MSAYVTMSKSRLSHKFSLRELTNQLSEEACINVIQSTYHVFGCNTLNQLLNKMIMQFTDTTTTDSFIKMENIIENVIHNNAANIKTVTAKSQYNDTKSLLRLPSDIIFSTSLYLNEKDIYTFEKCCHLFYKMVNNSSYLNQSNTFKTLNLNEKQLDKMTQSQYSFYKYSKATKLHIDHDLDFYSDAQEIGCKFDQAQIVGSYDKWLSSMFKSIKVLQVDDGTILLPKLPIDLLFDPTMESSLEEISIRLRSCCEENLNKFGAKYFELKKRLETQGQKIKVLERLRQGSLGESLHLGDSFSIEAKHIQFDDLPMIIDIKQWNDNFNKSLRTITFESYCKIDLADDGIQAGVNSHSIKVNCDCNLHIETLRFIEFDDISRLDLLDNQMLIESLNLHNSVKNLTIDFCLEYKVYRDKVERWEKCISNVLTKKYYFNLENVNILFYSEYVSPDSLQPIDWIFGILKKHSNILKYQFKQLNIGIKTAKTTDESFRRVNINILQWNSNIDNKFLDDYQERFDQLHQSTLELKTKSEQYQQLIQQWIN